MTSGPPRCPDGQIHDKKTGKCVPAKTSSLDDKDRYQAVRELAYAERYAAASMVLDAMTDPLDDRVLTYRGFLMRKTGRLDQALSYYRSAIEKTRTTFWPVPIWVRVSWNRVTSPLPEASMKKSLPEEAEELGPKWP